MKKADLKNGDVLISYQKGYEQDFLITESDNDLYLESGESRQRIEDSNIQACHLLITSDRTE